MVTVAQIREELLKHDIDEDVVKKTKGKAALEELLRKTLPENYVPDYDVVDTNESDFDKCLTDEVEEEVVTKEKPRIGDPEWHDYVMSLFTKDEVYEGNPTVDGMRRVAIKLFGDVFETNMDVIKPITTIDPTVTILASITATHIGRTYCGTADATNDNLNPPYNKFLTAMAETRAEGRALKRVLGLKKVISAEEMQEGIIPTQILEENVGLSNEKINYINIMCGTTGRGMNINVEKVLSLLELDVKTMTQSDFDKFTAKMSEYQQNKENIPQELTGYNADWH